MKNKRQNNQKKAWKNGQEARFEQMVGEYHTAKEKLESMSESSADYNKQKKHVDNLFKNAERFFKQHQ